jgi:DNA mismatch endonuclease Vsr
MDTLSRKERSQRMSLIRNRDTKPELLVRRMIHAAGYRYRLQASGLPGKPDLVFPARRKVLFVHGCFWHRHPKCALARLPKSRLGFWLPKLTENHGSVDELAKPEKRCSRAFGERIRRVPRGIINKMTTTLAGTSSIRIVRVRETQEYEIEVPPAANDLDAANLARREFLDMTVEEQAAHSVGVSSRSFEVGEDQFDDDELAG